MPNYAKFLKDILSKKRKFYGEGVVNLTATCSAVIQKSLPEKMQDPGSFTIPCTIGNFEFNKALCDLGANINLMPLSMVKRLSLGELTPCNAPKIPYNFYNNFIIYFGYELSQTWGFLGKLINGEM